MSQAFRCDGCRDFHSGSPALTIEAQGRTSTTPGEGDVWSPSHRVSDDYNPVGQYDGYPVDWPKALLQGTTVVLCAGCAVEHILPAIHAVVHEKERTN